MGRVLFLTTLLFASMMSLHAADKFTVKTNAREGFSGEQVKTANGVMLDKGTGDTVSVATKRFLYEGRGNGGEFITVMNFDVPRVAGKYILKAYAEGYDTVYQNVNIDKIGGREFEMRIPDLMFYRKSKMLGEATVTASKVKFYVKGDTLVYNADAFRLADGSMLDALVKQLPGVELKEGGQIYVNGEFVESLILNGKDFFQGDNNLMLNNLGAYTVKDIAVYDKWSDRSLLAGRDLGDSRKVMDVRLKREYMSGYIANVEAGGGSASRYMGRMFGMWYTERSRLTLIGNLNNLNDSRTPGQNDSYRAANVPGDFRTTMAAIDYNVSGPGEKWEVYGNTKFNKVRNVDISSTDRTNFLPGGNTSELKFADALSHNLTVNTKNTLKLRSDRTFFSVNQHLDYNNNDRVSAALSGTFTQEVENIDRKILDAIYSGTGGSLQEVTANAAQTLGKMSGHSIDAGGDLYGSMKFRHSPDLLGLGVSGNYKSQRSRSFNLYDIKFFRPERRATDYTFTRNAPDNEWRFSIMPTYEYLISSAISLSFSGGWQHSASDKSSDFYRLDRLGDIGVFGALPDGYASALDASQSYRSKQRSDNAYFNINFVGEKEDGHGGTWSFQVFPYVAYRWRALDYMQADGVQNIRHNSVSIDFNNTYLQYIKGSNNFRLTYTRATSPVPLNRLVNITDTRDPLNVFKGASSLKNSAKNTIEFRWWKEQRSGKHRWRNILTPYLSIVENELANSYTYNEETGVRTFEMRNVSGNWSTGIFNSYTKAFGRKDELDISSITRINLVNSTDYISTATTAAEKMAVKNLSFSEGLQLTWRLGRQQLGLNGRIEVRDTRSDNSTFDSFTATVAQYGVSGQFRLPFNFSLSTDFNLYTRRGYAYRELNTTDAVWNARLSYSLKGGRWLFMLDGFDLLHQLSNVTYNINAQGRTETYTNVLPRYCLFHVQYRFMVKPKKK